MTYGLGEGLADLTGGELVEECLGKLAGVLLGELPPDIRYSSRPREIAVHSPFKLLLTATITAHIKNSIHHTKETNQLDLDRIGWPMLLVIKSHKSDHRSSLL